MSRKRGQAPESVPPLTAMPPTASEATAVPGQAAYEAFFGHFGVSNSWAEESGSSRAGWNAAAQAAITTYAAQHGPWAERAAEILTEGQP